MGFHKDQLERDQEAGDCPECGEQCELTDEEASHCKNCDITYTNKCDNCGQPHSGDDPTCSDCFSNAVDNED